ncbi:MAG: 30S ribosomal protein S15 [Candidatus Micrarchaeota archaeon]|nr:30S ribosomal protein S15 [Candidatus Micrarchaeota archaeon]
MSRLHTKKKGKSGSRKFKGNSLQTEMSKEEIEKIVVDLYRAGNAPSVIGHILRDQYAVGSVRNATGKSILQIIETVAGKKEFPENLANLMKKAVRLRAHLERNKSDLHNKIKLNSIETKIRRLGKYYIRKKVLPADWKYDPAVAAIQFK